MSAGLRHRIVELEAHRSGVRGGLVLSMQDGTERTITGTARQFFRLVDLLSSEHSGDTERIERLFPDQQLALAKTDLYDIARATAMEGKATQSFGLLAALAKGPIDV